MVDTDLDFYGILHFCPEYLEFKAQQTDLEDFYGILQFCPEYLEFKAQQTDLKHEL